jgi:hypothetical protein
MNVSGSEEEEEEDSVVIECAEFRHLFLLLWEDLRDQDKLVLPKALAQIKSSE